jgi:hypothetical protein
MYSLSVVIFKRAGQKEYYSTVKGVRISSLKLFTSVSMVKVWETLMVAKQGNVLLTNIDQSVWPTSVSRGNYFPLYVSS